MKSPQLDLDDRKPIWDVFQMFWMDTEPSHELDAAIAVCARSKYRLSDLEHIYWNEVYPVVSPNLTQPIPEWTGYDLEQLAELIVSKSNNFQAVKYKVFHFEANKWWKKIAKGIKEHREDSN